LFYKQQYGFALVSTRMDLYKAVYPFFLYLSVCSAADTSWLIFIILLPLLDVFSCWTYLNTEALWFTIGCHSGNFMGDGFSIWRREIPALHCLKLYKFNVVL